LLEDNWYYAPVLKVVFVLICFNMLVTAEGPVTAVLKQSSVICACAIICMYCSTWSRICWSYQKDL